MTDRIKKKQVDAIVSSATNSTHAACGYPIHDLETENEKWKCSYCRLVIKEPVQLTECGHRCCRGCFECRASEVTDEEMLCPVDDCNTSFHKTDFMLDRAFKRELDVLAVVCFHKADKGCPWKGLLKLYQEHLDQAHVHYVCDLCDFQCSSHQLLAEHQGKNCPGRFQKCDLAPVCGDQMIPHEQFDAHLQSVEHQEAIALILSGKYELPEEVDEESQMESTSSEHDLEQETSDKLSDLAEKVQKLNEETVELSRDFVRSNEVIRVAVQEVNHFQTALNDSNGVFSILQPKQEEMQKEIDRLKENLEEHQHVSMDGTLTWRVDRVAERMADAQSERQPSIYSPIFYSSPTGYKMRARLYLHGDGNARRSHMSLFFLLMKGEFDAVLSWPFGYKVTFCLFDQTGSNRHIIDSFRPDTKSNSFQRPRNDANVASGIPKFFPLPMIQQDDNPYVREDTLFLKIIVDLTDIPKMILPYMLTLNPGLPNHVQQVLINQEKAKRQANTATTAQTMPTN